MCDCATTFATLYNAAQAEARKLQRWVGNVFAFEATMDAVERFLDEGSCDDV